MPIPFAERKPQLIGGLVLPRANVRQATQAAMDYLGKNGFYRQRGLCHDYLKIGTRSISNERSYYRNEMDS